MLLLKEQKKGVLLLAHSVLEDLAFKGHELPKLILDWRQITKLKNTYSDSLQEHLNPNTKRIHTSFLLAATTTGRLHQVIQIYKIFLSKQKMVKKSENHS